METATDRQIEILGFIIRFKEEQSYSPTFRDIADGMKIGIRAAADHVSALERKGYLSIERGKSRSIKVLRLPEAA